MIHDKNLRNRIGRQLRYGTPPGSANKSGFFVTAEKARLPIGDAVVVVWSRQASPPNSKPSCRQREDRRRRLRPLRPFLRRTSADLSASRVKYAVTALAMRFSRSSGASTPSGSTSRSNRR